MVAGYTEVPSTCSRSRDNLAFFRITSSSRNPQNVRQRSPPLLAHTRNAAAETEPVYDSAAFTPAVMNAQRVGVTALRRGAKCPREPSMEGKGWGIANARCSSGAARHVHAERRQARHLLDRLSVRAHSPLPCPFVPPIPRPRARETHDKGLTKKTSQLRNDREAHLRPGGLPPRRPAQAPPPLPPPADLPPRADLVRCLHLDPHNGRRPRRRALRLQRHLPDLPAFRLAHRELRAGGRLCGHALLRQGRGQERHRLALRLPRA